MLMLNSNSFEILNWFKFILKINSEHSKNVLVSRVLEFMTFVLEMNFA